MDNFTSPPDFEEKLQAAASAPSADPKFINRLRTQLLSLEMAEQSSKTQRLSRLTALAQTLRSVAANLVPFKGNPIMRKKLIAPALLAVVVIILVALFIFNPATPVSAQQILERAASAQSVTMPAQGIWHTIIKIYENPQALAGDRPGVETTDETYSNLVGNQNSTSAAPMPTNLYRSVTTDAAGKVLDVAASDGSINYSNFSANAGTSANVGGPLTIYRTPISPDERKKVGSIDPATSAKALFDNFRSNPRVELQGKITWSDGSQAYVLVNHNEQTQKLADGQVKNTPTGMTKMIFNAQTYQLLESQTSVIKDGQEIVISEVQFLVNEVLPANSQVAWNLSDLKGVSFVDETVAVDPNYTPVSRNLSEHELATLINAYVLKTIPAGFSLKIIGTPNDPQAQSYNYEINYESPTHANFDMMAVGVMEPGFIEKNFYDGSYKTASGLVINYSQAGSQGTSGMLTIPDGTSFLLSSSMSREQVQQLAEDLVPAK
jgi:hypothetical protein